MLFDRTRDSAVWITLGVSVLLALFPPPLAAEAAPTERVVLVTIDGLRWQDVFRGADAELLGEVKAADAMSEFIAGDANQRRTYLMPFLWDTVLRDGQILGNRDLGSAVDLANTRHFSYPGYSELLTGHADDSRIFSNSKVDNPNVTLLEWIEGLDQDAASERIDTALVAGWDVFPWIVAESRSGVFVNAGWMPLTLPESLTRQLSEADRAAIVRTNELMETTAREWENVRYDSFNMAIAHDVLDHLAPRLFHLALAEPDDWAHQGRYDRYLVSTRRCDALLAVLWERLVREDMAEHGELRTTMLLTVDHGRGRGALKPSLWTGHGADVEGAGEVWLAAIGAGIPALGERGASHHAHDPVAASQIAATVARLLGYDWPQAAASLGQPAAPDFYQVLAPSQGR